MILLIHRIFSDLSYSENKNRQLKTRNYHAKGMIEAMHVIAKKNQLNILSYHYNEAQLVKDQYDRDAASFKGMVNRWLIIDKGNKIETARDLLEAVFAKGGRKDTHMYVARIDNKSLKIYGSADVKDIIKYHSMVYANNGARYHEFY